MNIYELISITISITSLVISVYVFLKNKLYTKTTIEISLFSQINSAASSLGKYREDYAVFENDSSALGMAAKDKYYASIDGVLSAYNFACMYYFENAIKKKSFVGAYKENINSLFKNPEFTSALQSEGKYPFLNKFQSDHKH